MKLQEITPEEFERQQTAFANANFLQTRQMGEVHVKRGIYQDTFFLGWFEEEQLIAQALVVVRYRMRFFKEALLLQGPLFHEKDQTKLDQMMELLEGFMKKRGIARVEVTPYLINTILDEKLEIIADNQYASVIQSFENRGYSRFLDFESGVIIHQIFRKNLTKFESAEQMHEQLPRSLKKHLRKYEESQITVRELELDDLELFYRILSETSERKNFNIQSYHYFQVMKEAFKEDAKIVVAFLDTVAYQNYYNEQIEFYTNKIAELEAQLAEKGNSKKVRGNLAVANEQLSSYQKRKEDFEALDISIPMLPLSAYFLIGYHKELINLFGGTYSEYMQFGGSTLLNWKMIEEAKNENYDYYNFYGTIETDQTGNNSGNFNFKRQFGGELERLVGAFSKNLNPILNLLMKIKK